MKETRWTRRQAVGRALAGAGGLAAASLLGDAWAAAGPTARPASTGGKIHLLVSIAYQGAHNFQGPMQALVDDYIARNWTAKHPGVQVTTIAGMGCNGACLGSGDEIAASLAGDAADVIAGCCSQWYDYLQANIMVPLNPFIRRDNLDLGVFSPGHLAGLTTPAGILAFPEYDGPATMAVNLGMLDELGLPYPTPDWTHTQAEHLWRAVAGKRNGKQVYGVNILYWGDDWRNWWLKAWGGRQGTPDGTKCLLDSPQARAAYEWFIPLLQENVATGWADPYSGQAGFWMSGGWNIQSDMFGLHGAKWDYFPMPTFPTGKATFINNDFYAMNAYSKNPPDLVWDIFKFIVLDRGFQHLQFKTTFVTPNQVGLWGDWIEIVRQVAPPLRTKNLEAYAQAVEYGEPQYFFKYANAEAQNIQNSTVSKMVARQISVGLGLETITRQVDALEAAGAVIARTAQQESQQAVSELRQLKSGRLHAFTPPEKAGIGAAPKPARALVTIAGGTYALTGTGAGLAGSSDNGTFACAATTAPKASFRCRLTSVENVNEKSLDMGAKFGLMLRQNLTNDAPMFAVVISGHEGVIVESRPIGEVGASHQKLHNAGSLLLPYSGAKGRNFLKAPVWLQVVRDGSTFSAFTSGDGRTWQAAGAPVTVQMAGAWVGLFATGHESGKEIRVTFDSLQGFAPDTFVTMGS